jgi:tripartite-type tricarboxylate transporter receptor subunit TctC
MRRSWSNSRSQSRKLNFASFGAGSSSHLNGEKFKRLASIDIVHVPYKGSGDAMKDHLSGVVQIFFDGPTTPSTTQNRQGEADCDRVRDALAALPDLPTMREQGYDVGLWGYLWFWGPPGMSSAPSTPCTRRLRRRSCTRR